jgi:hypothetical protein
VGEGIVRSDDAEIVLEEDANHERGRCSAGSRTPSLDSVLTRLEERLI